MPITSDLIELSLEKAQNYLEQAESALEHKNIEIAEYAVEFVGDSTWCLGKDFEEVSNEFAYHLKNRTIVYMHPREPLTDAGERMYGSKILLVDEPEEGVYFRTQVNPVYTDSQIDVDYWKARIEKALIEEDLPVELD